MPTAPAADQLRLLDVQDADLRIQQLEHRRATLPVLAQLAELAAEDQALEVERVARGTEASDIRREVTKAEDDVQAVRARKERDEQRLASGGTNAKDLQALQSELEVLTRRLSDLEDIELEAMERLENAERVEDAVTARRAEIATRRGELERARDIEGGAIDEEIAEARAERARAADGLDAGLTALYERLREQRGGIGAAALQGSQCLGCHMTLNPADLRAIEAAAPDQVVRCEECGRILVRRG
ncbi:zinc ribbon domain-containing protein [Demequina sp. NBRC 110053]|uniref:zinc ribbon domain-containing protein n=1 Tax=Demequina sp. NBRC 110053 TaxID=1570342 RepID=UPI000A0014D1|nr:C4-type zinc ribbon domain-containing protein [Demequina sp. NBRC 110053]